MSRNDLKVYKQSESEELESKYMRKYRANNFDELPQMVQMEIEKLKIKEKEK